MARWVLILDTTLNQHHTESSFFVQAHTVLAVLGFMGMVSLMMAMCAQLHNRVQNKEISDGESTADRCVGKTRCMQMGLRKMSNKRLLGLPTPGHKLGNGESHDVNVQNQDRVNGHNGDASVVGLSTDAVWKRSILMGERCEPPSFSGVILYDEHGNLVPGRPYRSPRHPTSPSLRQLMSST
ncbi:hypothetical protein L7F22_026042 [Adiantum nelumboides]|nr:hypothetical protein [Adiantum nelumboides]